MNKQQLENKFHGQVGACSLNISLEINHIKDLELVPTIEHIACGNVVVVHYSTSLTDGGWL